MRFQDLIATLAFGFIGGAAMILDTLPPWYRCVGVGIATAGVFLHLCGARRAER